MLRIDRVGMHDNFFELGGDSLQAMMLHNALQDQLGEVVHGYVLFQAQSVGELAAYMRSHFGAAILRLHPDEPGVDEHQTPAPGPSLTVGDMEVAEVRRLVDTMAPIPPVSYPIREKESARRVHPFAAAQRLDLVPRHVGGPRSAVCAAGTGTAQFQYDRRAEGRVYQRAGTVAGRHGAHRDGNPGRGRRARRGG